MLCWTEQHTCCIMATVLLFSHIHRHVLAMVRHISLLLEKFLLLDAIYTKQSEESRHTDGCKSEMLYAPSSNDFYIVLAAVHLPPGNSAMCQRVVEGLDVLPTALSEPAFECCD